MNYLSSFRNNFHVSSFNTCVPTTQTGGGNNNNNNYSDKTFQINENNNQLLVNGNNKKIQEVWNKHTFAANNKEHSLELSDDVKMSWANDAGGTENCAAAQPEPDPVEVVEKMPIVEERKEEANEHINEKDEHVSPSHHARRPMNAFLIFCKKHRPIVRDRFPNLENRGVTKILGEWWSLLDENEKTPFTNLANEYKDAFLTANPNFKWYKLPAPPLRTLSIRPTPLQKSPSPLPSPSHTSTNNNSQPEFTPGKLADESQLGGLTSLMMNNDTLIASNRPKECCHGNENEKYEEEEDDYEDYAEKVSNNNNDLQSPVSVLQCTVLPPKPIKKRIYHQYTLESNAQNVSRSILTDDVFKTNEDIKQNNMTNQDIVDKVVDTYFIKSDPDKSLEYLEDSKETRKSGRQCKGKRYQKFMVEGKLLGNKRDSKLTQSKFSSIFNTIDKRLELQTPKLESTIKRLAERMDSFDYNQQLPVKINENDALSPADVSMTPNPTTENNNIPNSNNFNLDLRITNLPNLSYESFTTRKRESKKRKLRTRTSSETKIGDGPTKKHEELVGSKKRKNKHNITHLGKTSQKDTPSSFDSSDLIGLTTLAEVAACTQKLNESI